MQDYVHECPNCHSLNTVPGEFPLGAMVKCMSCEQHHAYTPQGWGPSEADPGQERTAVPTTSPLDHQEGGTHYKDFKIQPVEYIHANNLPFIEGNIVKYITRWKAKGGIADIRKVIHYAELLIELETDNEKDR